MNRWIADLNDEAADNMDRALNAPRVSGFAPTWRQAEPLQDAPRLPRTVPDAREAITGLVARLRAGDLSARDLLTRLLPAPTSDRSDQPVDDLRERQVDGGVERSEGGQP